MHRLARIAVLAAALLGPVAFAFGEGEAGASVAYRSPYTFEQTFGSAIRLVRVDLGMKITEKDVDSGYLLFEYSSPESGKRVHSGSIEVVRSREGAQVAVQLPAMPRYHEQALVDSLVRKLLEEHGEPPRKSRPSAPEPDAGAGDEPPPGS